MQTKLRTGVEAFEAELVALNLDYTERSAVIARCLPEGKRSGALLRLARERRDTLEALRSLMIEESE